MDSVAIHQRCNQDGGALQRVLRGELLVVTHDGRHVAQIAPVLPDGLATEMLERWRNVPQVDPVQLRADLDGISVRVSCEVPGTSGDS